MPGDRYRAERGELLMWLQHVLIREEQEAEAGRRPHAVQTTGTSGPRTARSHPRPDVALRPEPAPPPERRPAIPAAAGAGVAPMPVRTWTSGMVDLPTGAGTVLALRRDVIVERSWPGSAGVGFVLVVVKVQPLAGGSPTPDAETVEVMIRTLVEAAGQSLGHRDRVYRSGWREVTLMLRDADEEGARARARVLSSSLQPRLAARRLPPAKLMVRLLDPGVVLAVVKPQEGRPPAQPRPTPGGSRLSAAI